MNILTNWENFTDEELEQVKESLEVETQKRKEKIVINNFLSAFHELEEAGISLSYDITTTPIFDEDTVELKNPFDFIFL